MDGLSSSLRSAAFPLAQAKVNSGGDRDQDPVGLCMRIAQVSSCGRRSVRVRSGDRKGVHSRSIEGGDRGQSVVDALLTDFCARQEIDPADRSGAFEQFAVLGC
jgi:hypothetical protein